MTEISIKELRDLCTTALGATGLSTKDVDITVDHYVENELSGKSSHGIVRILRIPSAIKQYALPSKKIETIIDKGNIVAMNGHMNLGPVLGKAVLEESIIRTKEHGISFVGANSYLGNSGSMAYYLRRLTKHGLIGFMSCNSESMVTAPSGIKRFIGTNPIGIGVPSDDGKDFIADFATSAIAYGKVLVAVDKNETLPEGCIIDNEGNPSINPQDAFKDGAILPLADYRGFALGLFVEMVSIMLGGEVLHTEDFGKDGFFIIAMDPSKLTDGYATHVGHVLKQIRGSTPASGHDNVSIPGDRSARILAQSLETGVVDVADKTLEKLRELAS